MEILSEVCFPDGEIGVGIRFRCRSCYRKMVGKYHPLMAGQPFECPTCGYRQPLSPVEKEQVQSRADCLLVPAVGGDFVPSVENGQKV